jgi:hypothetical protein
MARMTIHVSDKSGTHIEANDGAVIRINFADGRRPSREADLTNDEAQELADQVNARIVARRGRKPTKTS